MVDRLFTAFFHTVKLYLSIRQVIPYADIINKKNTDFSIHRYKRVYRRLIRLKLAMLG